jgi:hypothetical protein
MPLHLTEQDIQKALAAHDEMRAAGAEVAVVVVEAAVAHLELWGLLWGRAQ